MHKCGRWLADRNQGNWLSFWSCVQQHRGSVEVATDQCFWSARNCGGCMNFLIGVVFGIVLATVGASGVAKWIDKGVGVIKQEAAQLK